MIAKLIYLDDFASRFVFILFRDLNLVKIYKFSHFFN
jgi:hypothetical protein